MWAPFFDFPCEEAASGAYGHSQGSVGGSSSGAASDASTQASSSRASTSTIGKASSAS
eukprot:CAMPEP_0171273146 /NCGR_PEP_ID=MMETSP0790-20130122/62128_1 /TAXON_ID=2925 /ORGANISM="Alexandrium catenella, Strain OF101" /LENGTH=57 /DNA_ID=CAMNT_0011742113 /DNA_START=1 /DNA_END=171 /DNA_ORIENTATION=+